MSYLLLDDVFSEHPKVMGLSDRAFRLHVTGLTFCARNLTDGVLTARSVKVICAAANATRKHVIELRDADLWLEGEGGGFEVKNYLEHNPTAEVVKKRRADAADRQKRYRERNALRDGTPDPDPSKDQLQTDVQKETFKPPEQTRASVAALVDSSLGSGSPDVALAAAMRPARSGVDVLIDLLPPAEVAANTRGVLERKFSELPPHYVDLAREELLAAGDTVRSRVRYLNGIADRMILERGSRSTPAQDYAAWVGANYDHPDADAVIDAFHGLEPIERQELHERAEQLRDADTADGARAAAA